MNLLTIENLNFYYGENQILKNINLHINKGEIVSLIGTSGVGKSTIFNLIAGIIKQTEGNITINHTPINKGDVGYMLQKDLLLEHKTVIDNIILPLIIKGIKKELAYKQAEQKLKEFHLFEYAKKYPAELSGGMRQRVALLRTSFFEKDIFLLDEPFSAVDALTKITLHKWYVGMHKKLNLTTFLITHDIDEAISLSDRIYILKNKPGEIVAEIKIDNNITKEQYKNQIISLLEL